VDFPVVKGVDHQFVDARGLKMHVATAGPPHGEPVLLLHGWPQHWYLWRDVIPPLVAAGYRVYAPDLRGYGWTDAPEDGYEKEQMAADVINLMDALGLERVKLAGHDWGGYVGWILALRHPDRIERFLALNIIHLWQKPSLSRLRHMGRMAYQIPMVLPLAGPRVAGSKRWVEFCLGNSRVGGWKFTQGEIDAFTAPYEDPAYGRAASKTYRAFQLRDLAALARGKYNAFRLEIPALTLFGVNDWAQHQSLLEGWEEHADDMRVELVEDTGHFIVDERPELVARRAIEFFAEP
jgi:pimeloyl-ACP methyl ester carboxylesterase